MKVIGIDIGTTSICGICMDSVSGKVCKVINRDNDSWLKGESFEKIQDPGIITKKIVDDLQ